MGCIADGACLKLSLLGSLHLLSPCVPGRPQVAIAMHNIPEGERQQAASWKYILSSSGAAVYRATRPEPEEPPLC